MIYRIYRICRVYWIYITIVRRVNYLSKIVIRPMGALHQKRVLATSGSNSYKTTHYLTDHIAKRVHNVSLEADQLANSPLPSRIVGS